MVIMEGRVSSYLNRINNLAADIAVGSTDNLDRFSQAYPYNEIYSLTKGGLPDGFEIRMDESNYYALHQKCGRVVIVPTSGIPALKSVLTLHENQCGKEKEHPVVVQKVF